MADATPIVLVVIDDVSVRESLELLIKRAGWQPETFASAQEFLALVHPAVPCCAEPLTIAPRRSPPPRRPPQFDPASQQGRRHAQIGGSQVRAPRISPKPPSAAPPPRP